MSELIDRSDLRITPAQHVTLQRFEAAAPAPESFRPLPGELEMHRAMNATPEQMDRFRAVLAPLPADPPPSGHPGTPGRAADGTGARAALIDVAADLEWAADKQDRPDVALGFKAAAARVRERLEEAT